MQHKRFALIAVIAMGLLTVGAKGQAAVVHGKPVAPVEIRADIGSSNA